VNRLLLRFTDDVLEYFLVLGPARFMLDARDPLRCLLGVREPAAAARRQGGR
jgi:hypothetical protein